MNLERLEHLILKVKVTGSMPKPFLRESSIKCYVDGFAHAHCGFKARNRGLICFSNKGLNRSDDKVIRTLAHELAHLKYPKRSHSNQIFVDATEQFYDQLTKAE